jgi:hypothetical protein
VWSKALEARGVGKAAPCPGGRSRKREEPMEKSGWNNALNDKRATVVGNGETATREEEGFEG